MKGPSIGVASAVFSELDCEPQTASDEQIDNFINEILTAIPLDELELHKENGTFKTVQQAVQVVALYLARSLHFNSPWWADEALLQLHTNNLPTTKTAKTVFALAVNLRLVGGGQKLDGFERQRLEDVTFHQVAAMRVAGHSAEEAARHGARWRDDFSDGNATVMASTIQKGYPTWASEPLLGKIWVSQLSCLMSKLSNKKAANLIQAHLLLAELRPSLPSGLKGFRR